MTRQSHLQSVLGKFSKLLAQENLRIVFSPSLRTAMFDTKNRVLYLPVWIGVSEDLMDMLAGHEVGHALHTPPTMGERGNAMRIPRHIVQIVEDCRIDYLLQKEYPGLRRAYRVGTQELLDRDFYGLKKNNLTLDQLSLIDRLNMHCKGGRYGNLVVPFTEAEAALVLRADNLVTPEDTLQLAKDIHELDKQQEEREKKPNKTVRDNKIRDKEEVEREDAGDFGDPDDDNDQEPEEQDGQQAAGENGEDNGEDSGEEESTQPQSSEEGDDGDTPDGEEPQETAADENGNDPAEAKPEDGDEETDTDATGTSNEQVEQGEPGEDEQEEEKVPARPVSNESSTLSAMEDKLSKSVTDDVPAQINVPTYQAEVVTYKDFLSMYEINGNQTYSAAEVHTRVMNAYRELTNTQVSTLVNRFRQKQAADQFRRTRQAPSGNLDTKRLYGYKTREDIFLRNEIRPDGQSHGMIMIIDGSSSMYPHIAATMVQAFALTEFCKKMQIPFDVYLFKNDRGISVGGTHKSADGSFEWNGTHRNFHVLSSRMTKTEYEKAYVGFAVAHPGTVREFQCGTVVPGAGFHRAPFNFDMTPLAKALFSTTVLVNEFKRRTRVQKMHVIVLSDGDDNIGSLDLYSTPDHTGKIKGADGRVFLIDELTRIPLGESIGHNVKYKRTEFVVSVFKKRHPDVSMIGFFITPTGEFNGERNPPPSFKTDHYYETTAFGMDRYFVVNSRLPPPVESIKKAAITGTTDALADGLKSELAPERLRSVFLTKFIDLIA